MNPLIRHPIFLTSYTVSGIYIHIPFCAKRCDYCNFFFITNLRLVDKFILNLQNEIKLYSEHFGNETFDTVYFGGGTPSVLSHAQIENILNTIHKHFTIVINPEVSMESNPEDFLQKDLKDYRYAGINRISFGVQSFKNAELKFLTRNHTAEEAELVIRKAKEVFDNINLDIIYSLPGQKISDVDFSLSKAVELGAEHISAYTLTYEEKTPLYKRLREKHFSKNVDSAEAELFEFVSEKLSDNGYCHYEISNFAKENFQCRHNLKYWNYENYIGFGPSAHSLFNGFRWNNFSGVGKYIEMLEQGRRPIEEKYEVSKEQMHLEYVMLALRSSGINFENYRKLFNKDFTVKFGNAIDKLIQNNFAIRNKDEFRLTEKGYAIADEIVSKYF